MQFKEVLEAALDLHIGGDPVELDDPLPEYQRGQVELLTDLLLAFGRKETGAYLSAEEIRHELEPLWREAQRKVAKGRIGTTWREAQRMTAELVERLGLVHSFDL